MTMDSVLDNLFSAIIRTENEAEQEKKLCKEAKDNIESQQTKLVDLTLAAGELRQKIENLEVCYNKSNATVSVLKLTEEYFEGVLQQIQQEIRDNTDKLNSDTSSKLHNFIGTIDDLQEGLCSGQNVTDFHELSEHVDIQTQLESENATDCHHEMKDDQYTARRHEMVTLSDSLQRQIIETERLLSQEREAIEKLKHERRTLLEEPKSGEQFKKLQFRLERHKICQD
ncbi:hypothetical protein BgiBS90_021384 [Biomphalaria glabrata]|nr:hypothetical protein BgiBS90_021384 [Biomphalaria glabrata]